MGMQETATPHSTRSLLFFFPGEFSLLARVLDLSMKPLKMAGSPDGQSEHGLWLWAGLYDGQVINRTSEQPITLLGICSREGVSV